MVSKSLKILIGVTVGAIVLAGIAVALYFTVFEGSVSKLEDAFTPSSQPETPSPTYYTIQSLSIQNEESELNTDDFSQEQCQQHCTDTSGCVAYRWYESSSENNQCRLYDSVTSLKSISQQTTYSGFSCDTFDCDDSYVTLPNYETVSKPKIVTNDDGEAVTSTESNQECNLVCSELADCVMSIYNDQDDNCTTAKGFNSQADVNDGSVLSTVTLNFAKDSRVYPGTS